MDHYLHMIPMHSRSIQVTTLCTAQQTTYIRMWVDLKNLEIMSTRWGNGGFPSMARKNSREGVQRTGSVPSIVSDIKSKACR